MKVIMNSSTVSSAGRQVKDSFGENRTNDEQLGACQLSQLTTKPTLAWATCCRRNKNHRARITGQEPQGCSSIFYTRVISMNVLAKRLKETLNQVSTNRAINQKQQTVNKCAHFMTAQGFTKLPETRNLADIILPQSLAQLDRQIM